MRARRQTVNSRFIPLGIEVFNTESKSRRATERQKNNPFIPAAVRSVTLCLCDSVLSGLPCALDTKLSPLGSFLWESKYLTESHRAAELQRGKKIHSFPLLFA